MRGPCHRFNIALNNGFFIFSLFWTLTSLLAVVFPVWWGAFAFVGFAVLAGICGFIYGFFKRHYVVDASARQEYEEMGCRRMFCGDDLDLKPYSDETGSTFAYAVSFSQLQESGQYKCIVVFFTVILFVSFSTFYFLPIDEPGFNNWGGVKLTCSPEGKVATVLDNTALWQESIWTQYPEANATLRGLLEDKCDPSFYISSIVGYVLSCISMLALFVQIVATDTPFHSGLFKRKLPSVDINMRFWDNPSDILNDIANICQVVKHVGSIKTAKADPMFAHLNWRLVDTLTMDQLIQMDDFLAMRSQGDSIMNDATVEEGAVQPDTVTQE